MQQHIDIVLNSTITGLGTGLNDMCSWTSYTNLLTMSVQAAYPSATVRLWGTAHTASTIMAKGFSDDADVAFAVLRIQYDLLNQPRLWRHTREEDEFNPGIYEPDGEA